MADLAAQLTENIEIGAVRIDGQEGLEVVRTDSLKTYTNARTERDPRQWEVALPMVDIESGNTADYDSVRQMWADSERGNLSFDFRDFVDGDVVAVKFISPVRISAPAGHLRKIETFTLEEQLN